MSRGGQSSPSQLWILPLAAALSLLPLVVHGGSCGHDLLFHVQSWIDAAQQLSHGHYPHWASTPAWNAGEPRFIFYPPASWLLGALLTTIAPVAWAPVLFVFVALTASGVTFHHLARHFVRNEAALIASALYLANPYMLFCAFERSAMAELLAAAWMPLLLLSALRERPTLRGVAVPLALLWLTNAPAAVIGSYALAVIAGLRLAASLWARTRGAAASSMTDTAGPSTLEPPSLEPPSLEPPPNASGSVLSLSANYIFGAVLGLALAAFYIIPAAYQRRFVQIDMARIPGLRPQDNFLFARTADPAHDAVNQTVTLIAVTLLILTAVTLLFLWWRRQRYGQQSPQQTGGPAEEAAPVSRHLHLVHPRPVQVFRQPHYLLPILSALAVVVAVLLTPISLPIWEHLPELSFLQFPWRLLTLLAPMLALSIALALHSLFPSAAAASGAIMRRSAAIAAVGIPVLLGLLCFHLYGQPCESADTPSALAHLLATHHGTLPTDEYTPTDADNNLLRSDDPAFWFIPSTGSSADPSFDPSAPAPHTVPTATELNPSIDTDDTPIPLAQTISAPAPHHLSLNLVQPGVLVLHLRDYPGWRVTDLNMAAFPTHLRRPDGLIALKLPAGRATIDIAWRYTLDQILGLVLSVLALIALILPTAMPRHLRRHAPVPSPSTGNLA